MGEHKREAERIGKWIHAQLMNVCDGAQLSLGRVAECGAENDNEYRGLVNDLRRVVLQSSTSERQTALDETGSRVTCYLLRTGRSWANQRIRSRGSLVFVNWPEGELYMFQSQGQPEMRLENGKTSKSKGRQGSHILRMGTVCTLTHLDLLNMRKADHCSFQRYDSATSNTPPKKHYCSLTEMVTRWPGVPSNTVNATRKIGFCTMVASYVIRKIPRETDGF